MLGRDYMAAKKVYAVKKGKQTGLFHTWDECRAAVDGYPGAKYKGFATVGEAREYLAGAEPFAKAKQGKDRAGGAGKAADGGAGKTTDGGVKAGSGEAGKTADGEVKVGSGEAKKVADGGVKVGSGGAGKTANGGVKVGAVEAGKAADSGVKAGSKVAGKTADGAVKGRTDETSGAQGGSAVQARSAGGRKRRTEPAQAQRPDIRPVSQDALIAYVDGSYDHALKKYAFGCVFLLSDGRIYTECGNGDTPECLLLRNVTGEMLGAMFAVRFALVNGFGSVELRYDYQGIEKWVTGEWRSKTDLTRKYAEAMRKWNGAVRISFQKVAAHTNVYYNEMADRMAKKGITDADGIPPVRRIQEMQPEEL